MLTRILLQFHPDWPFGEMTVMDAVAASGRYLSQFRTGTSNGGLTAHPGGDRWMWESRLFDGRYDAAPADSRPVYGAVDLGDPYGAAPRFGSAFVRLRPALSTRATFCYPDSAYAPEKVMPLTGVAELIDTMLADGLDPLDRYVEAHVHGGVDAATDAEAIVLDPCFRETAVHAAAARITDVEFHPGYRVETASLDPAYRGAEYAALAARLGTTLTPDVIGAAARSGRHDPQALKRVWHLVARYGRQADARGAGPTDRATPRENEM